VISAVHLDNLNKEAVFGGHFATIPNQEVVFACLGYFRGNVKQGKCFRRILRAHFDDSKEWLTVFNA
jgi:hypothetical protein